MNFPMVLTTPTLHSKLPRIHSSVICKEREGGKSEGGRGRGRKRKGKKGEKGRRRKEEGERKERRENMDFMMLHTKLLCKINETTVEPRLTNTPQQWTQ